MVVGGGAGGCGTANKFASKFGAGEVAVIDPASEHFYQPMWTLEGGGVKDLAQTRRPMESLLPGSARWLKDSVSRFEPDKNCLHTAAGDIISYDWLVVATGLVLRSVSRSDKSLGKPLVVMLDTRRSRDFPRLSTVPELGQTTV